MGAWYTIGIFAGIGAALGVAAAALLPRAIVALIVSAVVGAVLGYLFKGPAEAGAAVAGAVLGALGAVPLVAGTLRRGGTRTGTAGILIAAALIGVGLAFVPVLGYVEALAVPALGLRLRRRAPDRHAGLRTLAKLMPKPVVLVVIDGLTPSMFEAAATPALRFLAEHGEYRRAASTFPSLTPVCLSSIATGAHPDVHQIPHLVWWYRKEKRIVEYGSSFGAVRAAGLARSLRDTIVDLNAKHLGKSAQTIYEQLEGSGLTTAAINITCYRGTHRHIATIPGVPAVNGPKRLFFYSLYESDPTGAPIAIRNRALGSIDAYAAAVGRWLVTRDGFDVLVFYLPDYDYASHAHGPDVTYEALARSDAAVAALMDAAGGPDAFLERYAVVVCSDHGQSKVERTAELDVEGGLVTASNRAAMVYTDDPRGVAERLDRERSAGVVLFREDGRVVARRDGDEDDALLDAYPDGRARADAALRNPNAGEVLVSAAPGWEFVDLAGRHHLGGGSHGSLEVADSEVPMLTVGIGPPPDSITRIKSLVAAHFGV